MSREEGSLLHGRNTAPLSEREQTKAISTFYEFDRSANVRYDGGRTRFRPVQDDPEYNHEILIGPDLYPGPAIADPNSCLSMRCAVAHELAHRARHDDMTEINEEELADVDEALTSLSAILRFQRQLEDFEMLQLVSDAAQRLQKFIVEHRARIAGADDAAQEPTPGTE